MKKDYGTPEEFIQKYKELKNTDKMAVFYKVSATSIRNHAKKIGFDIKSLKPGKLSNEDKQKILDAYYDKTSTELAKEFEVSRGMITKLWLDHGLTGKDKSRVYYFKNQDYFNIIDTDQKAYFLGFIAADGCIYEPKDNRQTLLRISIAKKDVEILEAFKQAIETNKPISTTINSNNKEYVSLELSSTQMGEDLMKLGLFPRKTYLQTWVKLASPELQNAFIRGYFDGDGTISQEFNINSLHSVNIGISGYKNNLIHFAKYLKLQNLDCAFIQDKRQEKYTDSKQEFGQLTFLNKQDKLKFLNLIYPTNEIQYLTRKFVLGQKFKELCALNPKTWKYNADLKLNKIGETLHYSWGNTEVISQIAKGQEIPQSVEDE